MHSNISKKGSLFSCSRFADYFTLYIASYRRKLLFASLQIFIVTFIFYMFLFYTGGESSYQNLLQRGIVTDADPFWGAQTQFNFIFAFIFSALAGFWMFGATSSKKSRLMTFEIPASQMEKFFTWWLIYLPIFLVVMFVCFFLADLLRIIWLKIGTEYGDYAHLLPFKNLLDFNTPSLNSGLTSGNDRILTISIYCVIVLMNSLFAVGSIYFHKLSFLKTVASLFVGLIIFSLLMSAGIKVFFGTAHSITSRLSSDESTSWTVTAPVIGIICIYLYWLCYARFKETEIINRW